MNFRKRPPPIPREEPDDVPVPGVPGMRMPSLPDSDPPPPPEPSDPSIPPPPKPHKPAKTPSLTPKGPVSLVTAIASLVLALGGGAGIREVLGSGAETRQEIKAAEERLMAAIREHQEVERNQRQQISVRQGVLETRVAYQAGFLCELNQGKPNPSFPCDGFDAASKPLKAVKLPPTIISDRVYPTFPRESTKDIE